MNCNPQYQDINHLKIKILHTTLCEILNLNLLISGEKFSNLRRDTIFEKNVWLSHIKLRYLHYAQFMQITIKKVCEMHADCGFSEIQNSASTSNTKTIVLLQLLAEMDERFFVL